MKTNMDYELCKKLKDAGFPIIEHMNKAPECRNWVIIRTEKIYIPTLSELIEACGEGWFQLHKEGNNWQAKCSQFDWAGLCSSPEEAVSKLWLKLNEN